MSRDAIGYCLICSNLVSAERFRRYVIPFVMFIILGTESLAVHQWQQFHFEDCRFWICKVILSAFFCLCFQQTSVSSIQKNSIPYFFFFMSRSLQPRGLAETLCGSPLYMAPEIMQLQKYDAKVKFSLLMWWETVCKMDPINLELNTQADLWSVGAILFQLVTGKTPFTGNNQIQV